MAYKRTGYNEKEYILFKGEETIAVGTVKEISTQTGIKEMVLRYYGTPTYSKRAVNGKRLILLE